MLPCLKRPDRDASSNGYEHVCLTCINDNVEKRLETEIMGTLQEATLVSSLRTSSIHDFLSLRRTSEWERCRVAKLVHRWGCVRQAHLTD